MAYADDGDEEQRRRRALGQPDAAGGAPAAGAAPAAGMDRAPGAQHGTGFVNLQTYLGANQAAGQGMAQHVAGETARQGDAERAALHSLQAGQLAPTELEAQAQATGARARLAAPGGGGLQSVMAADYGGGTTPYTSGMSGFDAFLAGGAGGKTLQASGNAYGGLGNEVNAYNQQAAAYQPPTAAAPPSPQASAAPSSPGRSRPRAPAPLNPMSYAPEQTEPMGRNDPRRKGQQMDPNSWVARPWGGR